MALGPASPAPVSSETEPRFKLLKNDIRFDAHYSWLIPNLSSAFNRQRSSVSCIC